MFYPIKGGSVVDIQGLQCNLPPVGKVYNYFTKQVEERGVFKRSPDKYEQYWEIPKKPKNIKKALKEEAQKRKVNPRYFNPELQEYREREWDRTTNGYWFYIKGKPTYITGQHYFMLCHWTIDGKYPDYRDTDKEWHYFWEYCWYDPDCYGMLEINRRRDGKSVRAGCAIYYRTSRATEKKSGIQSKTDTDGERLFSKQVVNPFKKLESIFVPTMDKSKGSTPKNVLSFNKTSTTAKEVIDDENEKELISEIDYRASTETAYDGDKLFFIIVDEIGKSERANVYKRHGILIPCLTVGRKIIGKMLATTTVEDIGDSDKYSEGNFKRLWDESDHLRKDKDTNRTISGLYRYFLSSERSLEYDHKYGNPLLEDNRFIIEKERKARSGNSKGLVSYMRKYPLTVEEAFYTPGDECIFNVLLIEKQKFIIESMREEDILVRGRLDWKDGIRGSGVVFTESKNGNLVFNKKFNVHEECLRVNVSRDHFDNLKPDMKHLRCIGVDPFDHAVISDDNAGSKAAAYLYFKYNPMDELSETFVCEYLHRPSDLEEFHEDICKLAFLTGAIVVIENQKQMLIKHMKSTGFSNFVYHYGTTPGIPANPKNHKLLADSSEIYIENNIEKVPYFNLLSDWSKFNLKKTTKFDSAMAAGWALVGSYEDRITNMIGAEKPKARLYDASDFY